MSEPEAYYLPLGGDLYRPTRATESPWDRDLQHGGPPTALLGRHMAEQAPDPGMRLARITVEFLGPLPRQDLTVQAQIARPGKRIRMLEGAMYAGGRCVALARGWQIAVQPDLIGDLAVEASQPPPPQPQRYFAELGSWGYGESIEWRWEKGSYDRPGSATVWTRVRVPLVAQEPLGPLERALLVADSANGVSAVLPLESWLFVPPGIAVTLHRHPQGEWVRMSAETMLAPDGLGSTCATLADVQGRIGTVTQPLLVARR